MLPEQGKSVQGNPSIEGSAGVDPDWERVSGESEQGDQAGDGEVTRGEWEYNTDPLKGHPFCQTILSLLQRCPLVRGSITCTYICGTCFSRICVLFRGVSSLESVL